MFENLIMLSEELGRTPTHTEYKQSGLKPSSSTLERRYGSWSAAIEKAGLQPYRRPRMYEATRTAVRRGELNPRSSVGRGFASEVTVRKVLEIDVDAHCNVSHNFNHPFDLFHEEYGKIDVKSCKAIPASFGNKMRWKTGRCDSSKIDTFIVLMFDKDWKVIEHVLVVPSEAVTVNSISFQGPNSKLAAFEVDKTKYNEVYQSLSKDNCPIMGGYNE